MPIRSRPPWPHAVGTHLDLFQRIVVSPCSISAVLYGARGPVVLATNSTGRDLRTLAAVMNMPSPYDVINCEHFTAGAVGRAGRAASSTSRPRATACWSRLRCEKQQVGALGESLRPGPRRPARAGPRSGAHRPGAGDPVEPAFTVGGLGLGLRRRPRPADPAHRGARRRRRSRRGRTRRRRSPRWVITREQAQAFVDSGRGRC